MDKGLLDDAVIRDSGEEAFVVEFGETIDPAIGHKVAVFTAALEAAAPPGLHEVVPTFRSALVLFDPDATDRERVLAALHGDPPRGKDEAGHGAHTPREPVSWELPVCLDGEMAEDLPEAASALSISEDAVREALLSATYQVGMYGFAPGFAYLSGIADQLAIPRRKDPRPPMPEGSLIIAGGMAALTSIPMPTGWYVVGASALTMFRPDHDPMVPFAVGDRIAFQGVSQDELAALREDSDGGLRRAS